MNNLPFDEYPKEELVKKSFELLERKTYENLSKGEWLDEAYQTVNPRSIFVKNCQENSVLLDLGAGDGALSIYKNWPQFSRFDLKMHGVSLENGRLSNAYDSWEIADFAGDNNLFEPESFDVIVCAHFIEHIKEVEKVVQSCSRILKKGGEIYVEWPHPISKKTPAREKFLEKGILISTTNFFDDKTHISPWGAEFLLKKFYQYGLRCRAMGRVYLPFLSHRMIQKGLLEKDETTTTLGYWAYFGWSQYIILFKP